MIIFYIFLKLGIFFVKSIKSKIETVGPVELSLCLKLGAEPCCLQCRGEGQLASKPV